VEGTFFIFSLFYFAFAIAVVLVVMALWRIVKAQEATAAALQQIAHMVSRSGPPA
jgi:hypothetical protein